jgi:hypothetical protein
MEVVDNLIMVVIPGALHAGLDDVLFWGSLSFALVIAGVFAVPFNRWLIARGKGHAVVHETGIHGGPSPRTVGIAAAIAFVFGSVVLVAEAMDHGSSSHSPGHGAAHGATTEATGLGLQLGGGGDRAGRPGQLTFQIVDENRKPVHQFEIEHTKPMHVIVVREDFSGFQHLHPKLARGTWSVPVTFPEGGVYRVYADFKVDGKKQVLSQSMVVEGEARRATVADPSDLTTTDSGYEVKLNRSGSTLKFDITRGGQPVTVETYLGASGHLVALRDSDMKYLHTHPESKEVAFDVDFPSAGRYHLYLQFKHAGEVHTAGFVQRVG